MSKAKEYIVDYTLKDYFRVIIKASRMSFGESSRFRETSSSH